MNLEIDREQMSCPKSKRSLDFRSRTTGRHQDRFHSRDLKARAWLKARCEEAGLYRPRRRHRQYFRPLERLRSIAPVVGTGSHIDAIPNAGKYDGVVGVLGGLEAIRALQRSGFRPRNSIELLIFTSEEPTRFGIGCLGSRLLSGTLSPDAARKLTDKDGAHRRSSPRSWTLLANSSKLNCRTDTTKHSSNSTSSRVRCSSANIFRSVL